MPPHHHTRKSNSEGVFSDGRADDAFTEPGYGWLGHCLALELARSVCQASQSQCRRMCDKLGWRGRGEWQASTITLPPPQRVLLEVELIREM